MLQWPEIVWQLALEVQTVPLCTLQWPAWTQSLFCWQAVAVWMLQCPPASRQSELCWQLAEVMLQVPTCEQSLFCRQAVPVWMLQ